MSEVHLLACTPCRISQELHQICSEEISSGINRPVGKAILWGRLRGVGGGGVEKLHRLRYGTPQSMVTK
jgi:hypothetical protein